MKNAKISRRSFLLGLAACSAAGILTACKGDDTPASSASTSPEAPASSVSELEPIGLFTVEDFPKLDGSTACIPLMAQMMADTTGIDLEVAQSGISVSTTAYAWENFGLYPDEEYTARMLVVYEAPDYVKEELKEANAQLEQKPIGRDALVFIVNENNPVKSLTRQQLKDIYAGKITNWKEVGGEDLAIVPFQRGEDSGSQTLFRKLLIQGSELMDPPAHVRGLCEFEAAVPFQLPAVSDQPDPRELWSGTHSHPSGDPRARLRRSGRKGRVSARTGGIRFYDESDPDRRSYHPAGVPAGQCGYWHPRQQIRIS